jgi:hypothetical protein
MTTTGKNRIMIFGPKIDGTYVVEFRTAEGEALYMGTREEPVSDTQDPSYSYIDRVIWAALVILIIGIGWLIVSSL